MRLIHRPRQNGKTSELIEWVKGGAEVPGYPGWSRVLLVSSLQQADLLRGLDHGRPLAYHQVFTFDEWRDRARYGRSRDVEVAVDNAEEALALYFGERPAVVSINDDSSEEPWHPQDRQCEQPTAWSERPASWHAL